jgi:hypothetical protein
MLQSFRLPLAFRRALALTPQAVLVKLVPPLCAKTPQVLDSVRVLLISHVFMIR